MCSPEHIQSYVKWDTEGNPDMKSDRTKVEEEWAGDDKRKHRSSRSKRSGNGEDAEGVDSNVRKRSTGDRNENRKRTAGLSRMGSDEDDYQRSKQMKKKQEESALEKLSNWYQDGEAENKHDGGDKSGNRVHGQADENERKKSNSKFSDHESSQSRTKGKDERSHGELEKGQERESRPERRESSQEKGHGSSDQWKSLRRKWDEADAVKNTEDSNYLEKSDVRAEETSDPNHDTSKERSLPAKTELSESKSRDLDSNSDKGTKSRAKEERRDDGWSDRNRDREGSRDNWKRRQLNITDKDTKDGHNLRLWKRMGVAETWS